MPSFAKSHRDERAILALSLLMCLGATCQMGLVQYQAFHAPLWFEDAFMYYRYALHIRSGFGMSWNLDGLHTYGETSLLWGWVVWAMSYLRMSSSHCLALGSWIFGAAALVTMAGTICTFAQSRIVKSYACRLALVLVPQAFANPFDANLVSGMETMLAMFIVSLFLFVLLLWCEGRITGVLVGLAVVAAFLSRPDSAPVVVLAILLMFMWYPKRAQTYRSLLMAFLVLGVCVLAELIVCRAYFGSALPLGFYMKSHHAYKAYHYGWEPLTQSFVMVRQCLPYLVLMAFAARREDRKFLAAFLVPALTVFAYLLTVTQIMGHPARYSMPYLPLIVLPALILLDRRISEEYLPGCWILTAAWRPLLITFVLVVMSTLSLRILTRRMASVNEAIEHRSEWYGPAKLTVTATQMLPVVQYADAISAVSALAGSLPGGSSIAASEVGYLGASLPQMNVIDLAGLNDTRIALKGFSVSDLLARKPDVIWMPHSAYTYQHGLMMSDPELLSQYDVFAGGALYGIAVRKDSSNRVLLEQGMQRFWRALYGNIDINDYRIQSASWDSTVHSTTNEPQLDELAGDELVHAKHQ